MTYLRIFFKILLLFSLPAILLSQDVTLRTQADVDAFDPSITVIIGNLKIDGAGISDPIKDLSNLSNLTSITEDLDISHNIALTKLDGLNSITSIGNNLIILSNAALVNLDGLSNLSSIGSHLNISGNGSLTNIGGLSNITSIVSDLSIFQNYALINLTGLSNITSIGGGLTISSNTTLPNLDGLNNITSIGGTLKLSSNPALINLTGLSNITSIGRDLDIYYNNALTNLTGLNSLTSINHDLIIANNATLTNLNGLNNLTSIGGGLIVQYNAALTSFEGLNLSNITSMGLDLYIYYNNALTNLDGLNNITSIGGKLFIDNNDALTNIDGLNNLSSVGRDLDIKYNKALTNIEGLNNLSSVGGDLEVYSNPSLTDCCGIQNLLDTPGAIVGQIRIYNNPSECNSKEEILDTPCGININIQTFAPCINANNGMIQVTVSGYDTIPFFYSWDRTEDGASGYGSSLDDVFSIKNLSEGTYNITVITNRPDTAIKIGIVLEQIPGSIFEIIGITTVNSSNGFSNGSITVKTAGGTAPFSYEWSGVSSGSKTGVSDDNYTMPNLAQGEYFITLSDDAGNMQEVAVSLLDETVPVFPCTEPLDIVILNDVSGSVDATEYSESKQFFVNFLEEVNIGQDADESRAAIIEWSSSGQQEVKIDITGDIDALKDYINYNRSFSGGTSPHQAMEYGKNYLDSIDRADVEKVLILSTDGSNGQVSPSLIALADKFKADGYHIVTIAFDNAFANNYTRDILTKVASNQLLAPGAPAYSLLDKDLAKNIVNLYLCPIDPGSTATAYFNRDGAIDIIDIIPNGNCPYPNGVEIKFTLEALRELSLPAGTPVTFYYNNPELFGATSVFTWVMPCALPAGAIDTFSVVLPVYSPGNIFAVLNDDGSQSPPIQFPITDIEELAYSNNIDNQRICADGNAILQAIKYTTTPKPICDTLVLYTINVCNISEIDAFGVTVNDLPPAGFVLTGTTFNDNGCALDNGDNYDIPAGCCISLTLTYDASKAENGYYRNQGVDIDGPSNQEYIDFDGSNTTAEDVIIDGSIDCPSTTVEFSKEVNVDESCDDAFVVYTFTINNEMNIPLQGLVFTDILPSSCTWAFEPYLLQGLNIGSVDIKDNTATFTIDEVQANTVATFQMDAALGLWDADGTLSNTATIENVPDPDNGGYKKIYSNSVSTDIIASPTVSIPDTIYVSASSKGIKLDAVINNAVDISWTSSGDGTFSDSTAASTIYTKGIQDSINQQVYLFISLKSNCDETGKSIVIIFEQCSLSVDSITEGDCNNNSTPSDNTDDSFDVNFTVSAQNGSASGTYVVTQGNDSLGVFEYNKEQKITLSADGNTYTLRFKDSDSGDCFVEREVSQNSCSDECALTLESVSIGDCNDNSTPSDNTDDSFDVNFTLSAQNGSTSGTYSVTQGNDSLGVFEYNKEQKVTLPADGNTYTLIFKDSDSGDCFVEKEVSQNSCSDECALTLESVSIGDCNDNSTPSDNTDDSFEVSFTVSAQNSSAGGTYVVTQGNDTLGVFEYNKEQKITLPADGNTYTLIFKDIDSGDCFVEREVSQNSCSDECALTLDSVSIGDCNDNSTPSDNTDDSFDVSFTVSAQNSSAGGTYVVTQGNDTLGVFEYNKEQKISLPADGNTYTLIFKDSDSGDCFVEKEVSQNSCSDEIITDTTSIYVPNIFSPDGDGINDIWYITFINFKPTIVEAVIFDRWGEKVAKWHDVPNVNWDGTFNGKKVNPGVFVYYIIYKKIDGKEVLLMGDITVVR